MSVLRNATATKYKLLHNGSKLKKGYHNGVTQIYSAGSTVTYHVDADIQYTEEVDSEATCLAPTTFTPEKDGWIFVGWREDSIASDEVLTEKIMDDEPIVLYAVFSQNIAVTYFDGSTTPSTASGIRYYNNSNIFNPNFTLDQAALPGWTARGWSTSTAADGDITYDDGATFTIDSDVITLYGMYQQTITLSYSGNGATSGSTASQTGTRYYNSGMDVYSNPSFKLASNGFSRTYYTFNGWNIGAVGTTVTLSANTTAYAKWIGTPYSITSFNISEWTFSKPNGDGDYDYGVDSSGIWVSADRTAGNFAFGQLSKTISTHGCTKLRVRFSISSVHSPWCTIYGKEFSFEENQYNQYAYFDVSGENINFYFAAQSGAGENCNVCTVHELYFYNG